jgi:hypothetical protein
LCDGEIRERMKGAHRVEKGVEERGDWKERKRKSGRMRRERRRSKRERETRRKGQALTQPASSPTDN